jgi:hypothetical protein
MFFKNTFKRLTGTERTHFYIRFAPSGKIRNLADGSFFDLAQREDQLFIGAKLAHRPGEDFPGTAGGSGLVDGAVMNVKIDGIERGSLAMLSFPAEEVVAGRECDSREPMLERCVSAKLGKVFVSSNEHLLRDVFELMVVSSKTGCGAEDTSLMPPDEVRKRGVVTAEGGLDELFIESRPGVAHRRGVIGQ